MKEIKIGNSGVSELMLGTMRISSLSDEALYALLAAAQDCGINAIDTADVYGDGVCEEKLGHVFAAHPGLRDQFFLQTKCGIRKTDTFLWYDFSKTHIIRSVEASLQRMQTDHIDCLLLHRPDALMEPGEIEEAFTNLHDRGLVANFGVSNMDPLMIDLLETEVTFPIVADQIQLSAAFTPALDAGFSFNMETDAAVVRSSSILEYCRLNDIVVQAWSPLQYGFFKGLFVGSDEYPQLNTVLSRIAAEQGGSPETVSVHNAAPDAITPEAVAIAWILRYPAKMQVVLGTTNKAHLIAAAHAAEVHISKKQWYEIYAAAGNQLP